MNVLPPFLLGSTATEKLEAVVGELSGSTALVVIALLASVIAIVVAHRWFRWSQRNQQADPREMLSNFRRLAEKGEMSREEFDQVRAVLGGKVLADAGIDPTKFARLHPKAEPSAMTDVKQANDPARAADDREATDEYEWIPVDIEKIEGPQADRARENGHATDRGLPEPKTDAD